MLAAGATGGSVGGGCWDGGCAASSRVALSSVIAIDGEVGGAVGTVAKGTLGADSLLICPDAARLRDPCGDCSEQASSRRMIRLGVSLLGDLSGLQAGLEGVGRGVVVGGER